MPVRCSHCHGIKRLKRGRDGVDESDAVRWITATAFRTAASGRSSNGPSRGARGRATATTNRAYSYCHRSRLLVRVGARVGAGAGTGEGEGECTCTCACTYACACFMHIWHTACACACAMCARCVCKTACLYVHACCMYVHRMNYRVCMHSIACARGRLSCVRWFGPPLQDKMRTESVPWSITVEKLFGGHIAQLRGPTEFSAELQHSTHALSSVI